MAKEKKIWATPKLLNLSTVDSASGKIGGAEQGKLDQASELNYRGPGSRGPTTTPGTS